MRNSTIAKTKLTSTPHRHFKFYSKYLWRRDWLESNSIIVQSDKSTIATTILRGYGQTLSGCAKWRRILLKNSVPNSDTFHRLFCVGLYKYWSNSSACWLVPRSRKYFFLICWRFLANGRWSKSGHNKRCIRFRPAVFQKRIPRNIN